MGPLLKASREQPDFRREVPAKKTHQTQTASGSALRVAASWLRTAERLSSCSSGFSVFFFGGGGGRVLGAPGFGTRSFAELSLVFMLVFRLLLQLRDLVVASLQDRGQVVCFYVGAAHKLALPRRLGEQDDQDRSDHWGFRCCAVPTTITLGGTECGARPSPIPLVSTDTSFCRTACLWSPGDQPRHRSC